jgi:hypothetical protein
MTHVAHASDVRCQLRVREFRRHLLNLSFAKTGSRFSARQRYFVPRAANSRSCPHGSDQNCSAT